MKKDLYRFAKARQRDPLFKISKQQIEAIEREFYLKYNNYKLNNMLSR
jgi:hypothetical protein|tara:strand:- start:3728 stop:3871 length:144 start_codon:yes stop_codon:yes gene_type:complete